MERINSELQYFIASIIWGILILILYDVIRIFRRIIHHNAILAAVEDILYWIVCAFLIFRMMYICNNGTIRSFSILGMFLGMVVYNRVFSALLVNQSSKAIIWVIQLLRKMIGFFCKPARFVLRRFKWLLIFFFKKGKKLGNILYKPLKSVGKTFKISLKKR